MKTRDEKGRFASMPVEMTDEQREAICYKSKLLNRYFDDYDEMMKAEEAYRKAHEAELQAKEARQNAVAQVQKSAEDYIALIEKNNQLRKELTKAEEEAYNAYKAKLAEFSKEHKGYHLTYTSDGKNIEFKVEENRQDSLQEYINYQNRLIRKIFEDFWF